MLEPEQLNMYLGNMLLYRAGIASFDVARLTDSQKQGLGWLLTNIYINEDGSNKQVVDQNSFNRALDTLIGTTAIPKLNWYLRLKPKPAYLAEGNKAYNERATNQEAWNNKLLEALDKLSSEDECKKAYNVFGGTNQKEIALTFFGSLRKSSKTKFDALNIFGMLLFTVPLAYMILQTGVLLGLIFGAPIAMSVLLPICGVIAAAPIIIPILMNADHVVMNTLVIPETAVRLAIGIPANIVLKVCSYIPVIKDVIDCNAYINAITSNVIKDSYSFYYLDEYPVVKNPVYRNVDRKDNTTITIPSLTIQASEIRQMQAVQPQQLPQLMGVVKPHDGRIVDTTLSSTAIISQSAHTDTIVVDPNSVADRGARQNQSEIDSQQAK